jgi:hypothetical protein
MIHFHLIIDDSNRQFFINESANGMRMHYEMQLAARMKNRTLRDTDFWAESREAILDHMKHYFPGYQFNGEWISPATISNRGTPRNAV